MNRGLRPVSRARRGTISAAVILGMLLVVAGPVLSRGGRTLADWQRDLRDPAVGVRVRVAQALVAFDQRAVPVLTGALGDKEYRVRANAAVVLGTFGPATQHAVPALARALKDPNLRVRELAGEALNRIVSPAPNQLTTLPLNCH